MKDKEAPHWALQLVCVACIAFTSLTLTAYFIAGEAKVIENLVIAIFAAVFAVFVGPILRAKVINGREVKNG